MDKFFRIPFAQSGDRSAIPDALDSSGFVSYTEGYGDDYERPNSDPQSKTIERQKMNSLFFAMSKAIAELQSQGVPDFITSALNGGTPFPYAINALVRYSGVVYISLNDGNTAAPSDPSHWTPLGAGDSGLTIITGDGVTDNSADIVAANTAGLPVLAIGILNVVSATTLSVPLIDTLAQVFTLTSAITIDNGFPVRPEWWGIGTMASITYAIAALPSSKGGIVLLANARYKPNGHYYGTGSDPGNFMGKAKITIRGTRMPRFSLDMKTLIDGSIIEDMFLAYADNISFENLGVDSGKTVIDTYFGGVVTPGRNEGLLITYPSDGVKSASPVKTSVRLHNVCGLTYNPQAVVHAIIAGEGVAGLRASGEIVGAHGVHGVVFKCIDVRTTDATISAYLNGGDGIIIKSDAQASAISGYQQHGSFFTSATGPSGYSPWAPVTAGVGVGVRFHASGNDIDQIQIEQIINIGYLKAIEFLFAGSESISSIDIGKVISDQYGVTGSRIGIGSSSATGALRRVRVQSADIRNTGNCVELSMGVTGTEKWAMSIGRLAASYGTRAIDLSSASSINVDFLETFTLSDAVYRIAGTARASIGRLRKDSVTPNLYSSVSGGFVPALRNGWTAVSGGDGFSVNLAGGIVQLQGLIKPGTSNVACNVGAALAPLATTRLVAQAYSGSVQAAVPVTIATNGDVVVNEAAGGFANCTNWLSITGLQWPIPA